MQTGKIAQAAAWLLKLAIPLSIAAGAAFSVWIMGAGTATPLGVLFAIAFILCFAAPHFLASLAFRRPHPVAHAYIALYWLGHLACGLLLLILAMDEQDAARWLGLALVAATLLMILPTLLVFIHFRKGNGTPATTTI